MLGMPEPACPNLVGVTGGNDQRGLAHEVVRAPFRSLSDTGLIHSKLRRKAKVQGRECDLQVDQCSKPGEGVKPGFK